jgi:GNAT superfamily N-acetyltransferase
MLGKLSSITFDEIYPIWRTHLWPDRTSEIETHSAMTWPFGDDTSRYDMRIFSYPVTYLAKIVDNRIIGTFSGFKTSESQYRLRGAWVDPLYRRQGILTDIINELHRQAMREGATMVWCTPRQSSLSIYKKLGYITYGDFFDSETADSNIYVSKQL